LYIRFTCKNNNSDSVVVEFVNQFFNCLFCFFKSIRFEIFRLHAVGDIKTDNDVRTFAFHFF